MTLPKLCGRSARLACTRRAHDGRERAHIGVSRECVFERGVRWCCCVCAFLYLYLSFLYPYHQ